MLAISDQFTQQTQNKTQYNNKQNLNESQQVINTRTNQSIFETLKSIDRTTINPSRILELKPDNNLPYNPTYVDFKQKYLNQITEADLKKEEDEIKLIEIEIKKCKNQMLNINNQRTIQQIRLKQQQQQQQLQEQTKQQKQILKEKLIQAQIQREQEIERQKEINYQQKQIVKESTVNKIIDMLQKKHEQVIIEKNALEEMKQQSAGYYQEEYQKVLQHKQMVQSQHTDFYRKKLQQEAIKKKERYLMQLNVQMTEVVSEKQRKLKELQQLKEQLEKMQ